MPLDAVTVSALTRELRERIEGGRIDKVQQPERDMLLISLRAKGDNLRLVNAAGTGNARVHLTSGGFENPAEPPMFCMLMRKHLVGARIASVSQPEGERMLCKQGHSAAAKLHRMTVSYVNAPAQAAAAKKIMPALTAQELAVYKRGRNAKVNSVPQKATEGEYHAATGLEALFGWLYLQGMTERIDALFSMIMEDNDAA